MRSLWTSIASVPSSGVQDISLTSHGRVTPALRRLASSFPRMLYRHLKKNGIVASLLDV
jgi:hypothetical protein